MNFLFIHQNFPGQFRHIALHLLAQGHQVLGLGSTTAPGLPGISLLRYRLKRAATKGITAMSLHWNTALFMVNQWPRCYCR